MAEWPTAADNFNHGQATLSTTTSRLAQANPQRRELVIINTSAIVIYVGSGSHLTTSNGAYLSGVAGSGITIPTRGEVWVVAASGTPVVCWVETVDDA